MAQVYVLKFPHSSFVYVGCTRGGLAKRLREHRCLLRAGKHTCTALQIVFDQGPGEIDIASALHCADDLHSRRSSELAVMEWFGDRLLNDKNSFKPTPEAIAKGIEASRTVKGNRWTPEANEKRRLAQLGKPKGHGAKISATKQARKDQQVMR